MHKPKPSRLSTMGNPNMLILFHKIHFCIRKIQIENIWTKIWANLPSSILAFYGLKKGILIGVVLPSIRSVRQAVHNSNLHCGLHDGTD
jgi:hypothetical protein